MWTISHALLSLGFEFSSAREGSAGPCSPTPFQLVYPFVSPLSHSDQPTASTYFHLPVDEQEDKEINGYQRKYITWDGDLSAGSSSTPSIPTPPPPLPSKARPPALDEVLANEDLYGILGVSKSDNLDKSTLRRAYLLRSKACHPEYAVFYCS